LANQEPEWNLSELFNSTDDPKIDQAINETTTLVNTFERTYRGKIVTLDDSGLLVLLRSLDAFKAKFNDINLYSNLSFSANMTLPKTQALNDRVKQLKAAFRKQLAFYPLELGTLLKNNPAIIQEPTLSNYRCILNRLYRRIKHQLSEVEEQIIIDKDLFGVTAWEELQVKWLNTRVFDVEVLKKVKRLSYGEANGLLTHPDRDTRESANRSIYGLLGKDGEIFATALRSICADWVNVSRRRKYHSPMESSLISNDTEFETIDNLLRTIEKNVSVYQYYLKLKAKLMKLPILGNHDVVAPLHDLPELQFTLQEAQKLILQAYSCLDPQYATAAREMFAKHHIDSTPRFGKCNGAFCSTHYNGKSAYILTNYNGTLNDVFTLAHELGHATHGWYATRNQTPLNLDIPMIVAEVASIFGELLLTDLLLEKAKSDDERKAVLCLVLDEAGITSFQVTARVWFEQALYASIEKGEFLDYETVCNHWVSARNRIYGNAVTWFPEMDAEWTMKPHYYMANFRFYNYPYVYAQMFVYALYDRYLEEGTKFAPKLKKALSAGSSLSPLEIGNLFNLDVSTPDFWNKGVRVFQRFIKSLREII
jgi:oligoendopeptidase F